ncbi:MAG TPA: TadE/TadG family type IV pilus assembly protein [Acidimicrobiales bacterium]|nr:TadE/TadG family type IV pilus assembly protein [Acidimicrobiales bacterium]HVV37325.1 TadE/TadG family type IV pilus assembly protein [Acidimicrobiales bacterium]
MIRRPRFRGDAGSAAAELVLLTPALVAMLLLVVMGGRYAQARADVDAAARDAARAGSIARGPDSAAADGASAARARLHEGDVTCRTLNVALNTGEFRAGGSVTATVTCAVDLADLSGLKLPASRTVTASFTEPIDAYRGTDQ